MTEEKKETTAAATEGETKTTVVANREAYKQTRSASGAKSLSNGDEVATAMEGMNIEEVYTLAKEVTGEDYQDRYAKLNVGMQRMNLGNRIRGVISKLNKAGAVAEGGNPNAGTEKFEAAAKPIVERVQKRIQKEADAKQKAADDKQKEATQKAAAKAADDKRKEAKDKKAA